MKLPDATPGAARGHDKPVPKLSQQGRMAVRTFGPTHRPAARRPPAQTAKVTVSPSPKVPSPGTSAPAPAASPAPATPPPPATVPGGGGRQVTTSSFPVGGVLLVVFAVLIIFQLLGGDLTGRILSYWDYWSGKSGTGSVSTNSGSGPGLPLIPNATPANSGTMLIPPATAASSGAQLLAPAIPPVAQSA